MPDSYEHYISKNIQAFYRRRLFSPMIYLVLLAVLWIVFPLGAMLRPAQLSDNTKIADAYKNHHRYVRMTFTDLKFSGYTCETYGQTRGYYYYTTQKNNCSIILLTPHTCEEGLPTIDRLTVTGRIVKGKESYLALLNNDVNIPSSQEETAEGEHGLGLKIVQQIVKVHQGNIQFSNITPHGLKIEICLPEKR